MCVEEEAVVGVGCSVSASLGGRAGVVVFFVLEMRLGRRDKSGLGS